MTTVSPDVAIGGVRPLPRPRADDVMTGDVATVGPSATVGESVRLMHALDVRHLPIIDGGRCIGMLDDRIAVLSLVTAGSLSVALEQPVTHVMNRVVPTVGPATPLPEVAAALCGSRSDAVAVVDHEEHLLGILTSYDVVAAVAVRCVHRTSRV